MERAFLYHQPKDQGVTRTSEAVYVTPVPRARGDHYPESLPVPAVI